MPYPYVKSCPDPVARLILAYLANQRAFHLLSILVRVKTQQKVDDAIFQLHEYVLELLAQEGLTIPSRVLGVPDALIEHGETPESVGVAPADIRRAVTELVGRG